VGRPERDDAWYQAEQPMRHALVAELQRLKRRAQRRWPIVLVLAVALTAGVLYKRSKKVRLHRAKVVLAVTEGSLASGHIPMPILELRDYVAAILISNQELEKIIEEQDLFPLRHTHGMAFAVSELRDMFDVGVHRNYFLYEYNIDAPRSARIVIVVTHSDPDFAWRMARRLASIVVEGEQARRLSLAEQLAREAEAAIAHVQARGLELERAVAARTLELAAAEEAGDRGRTGALRVEVLELEGKLHQENELLLNLTQQANADEMALAIDRAGLGMTFDIAEEKRPFEEPGARLYLQVIIGVVVFFVMLPVVAIFIGAFDTRIHDREDAERIGVPVLGHLPAFPGDHVGSLRARGVRGRRVAS
jgi:hypothetical protein